MIRKSVVAATALGSVVVGSPAADASLLYGAGTATETIVYPSLQPTNLTGLNPPTSEVLAIDQANSGYFGSSYSISAISLTFSGILTNSGTLTNNGSRAGTATGYTSTTFSFTAANMALNAALAAVTISETLNSSPATLVSHGSAQVSGSNGVIVNGTVTGGGVAASPLSLSSSLFSQFEFNGGLAVSSGGGQVNVGANTSGTVIGASNVNFNYGSVISDAASSVTIVYTYSPVSEPTSVLVLASGLLGLVMLRNRRQG